MDVENVVNDNKVVLSKVLPMKFPCAIGCMEANIEDRSSPHTSNIMFSERPDGFFFTGTTKRQFSIVCTQLSDTMYWRAFIPTTEIVGGMEVDEESHLEDESTSGPPYKVALFVDASITGRPAIDAAISFLEAMLDSNVRFYLYLFNHEAPISFPYVTAQYAINVLKETVPFGGFNLAKFQQFLTTQFSSSNYGVTGLLFTDGMDSFQSMNVKQFEHCEIHIHCVQCEFKEKNQTILKWIATMTSGSSTIDSKDHQALKDLILRKRRPTRVSNLILQTDDEDVLPIEMFEDEDIQTVPDFRLQNVSYESESDKYVVLCGKMPSAALSMINATVDINGVTMPIRQGYMECSNAMHRMLEVDIAQQRINHLRTIHPEYHASREEMIEIAIGANIASEYTSFLHLTTVKQFYEYDIKCPVAHPLRIEWMEGLQAHNSSKLKALEAMETQKMTRLTSIVYPLIQRYKDMCTFELSSIFTSTTDDQAVGYRSLIGSTDSDQPVYRSLGAPSASNDKMANGSLNSELEKTLEGTVYGTSDDLSDFDRRAFLSIGCTKFISYSTFKSGFNKYLQTANEITPSTFIEVYTAVRTVSNELAVGVIQSMLKYMKASAKTCRCVAYHLMASRNADRSNYSDAILLFELVKELDPNQPHSYIDCAMSRFLMIVKQRQTLPDVSIVTEARLIVKDLFHVLETVSNPEWYPKYKRIEWPCVLILNILQKYLNCNRIRDSIWPDKTTIDPEKLIIPDFKLGLMAWLCWDTDNTDVDLHINEPNGCRISYANPSSRTTGAQLSEDVLSGYGPEVYVLPKPIPGTYEFMACYYTNNQASTLTGATSALLWTIQEINDVLSISINSTQLKTSCTDSCVFDTLLTVTI